MKQGTNVTVLDFVTVCYSRFVTVKPLILLVVTAVTVKRARVYARGYLPYPMIGIPA